MAIPINPTFQGTGSEYSAVVNNALGNGGRIASENPDLSSVDALVSDLSGAPGSNSNYSAIANPGANPGASGVNTVARAAGGGGGGGGGGGSGSDGLDNILGAIGTGLALLQGIKTIGTGIATAVSSIRESAGQINDALSKIRAKKLPKGAEANKTVTQIRVQSNVDLDWRIRLSFDYNSVFGSPVFAPLNKTNGLTWPFTPRVSINYRANYTPVEPTHNNFPFQAYKNSAVDDVQIAGEFSVQTSDDAKYWIAATHFLKTATKMFYGTGDLQGNPPIICRLSGYSSFVFNDVPVVVKAFNIDLPDNVNYINTEINNKNHWVPTLSTITVTVAPVYNRERLRTFSLKDFAKGAEISRGIM